MIGILPVPVSGVGARISGSTSDGGHSTPSDRASLSPSGSWDWPTVESRGAFAPPEPIRSQLVGDCGGGGAVCCEGVAGVGGDCAIASADVASNAQTINIERFVCMRAQPRSEASVPTVFRLKCCHRRLWLWWVRASKQKPRRTGSARRGPWRCWRCGTTSRVMAAHEFVRSVTGTPVIHRLVKVPIQSNYQGTRTIRAGAKVLSTCHLLLGRCRQLRPQFS
jgi:hypothetical protein